MNKLLIGTIIVLILIALIPIKTELFSFTNQDRVTATIAEETEESQPLIHLVQSNLQDNSVLTLAENLETRYDVVEIEQVSEQEMQDNDRNIFISIGSILLFGIILLIPLHLQKL